MSNTQNTETEANDLLHKASKAYNLDWRLKALIMSVVCYLFMEYFFIMSLPQGIENNLLASPYSFSNTDYGIFYACLSFPNLLSPLFMGIYLDNNGWNLKIVLFLSVFIVLGSAFCLWGASCASFFLLCLGNVFVGIPIENIAFITKKISLDLYDIKSNIIASGILLLFARIGNGTGSVLVPYIYSLESDIMDVYYFQAILLLGAVVCLFIVLFLMPKEEEHSVERKLSVQALKEFFKFFDTYIIIFWIVSILIGMIFFSFYTNANTYLTIAMVIDETQAGTYLLILVFSLGVFQVLTSLVMSRVGYLNYWLIAATFCTILCWALFIAFYQIEEIYLNILPLFFLGFVHSINSNYNYSVSAIIVPRKHTAGALGVMQCTMNFSRMMGPFIFGVVRDFTMDYFSGFLINFVVLSGYAVVLIGLALWMNRIENRRFKGMSDGFGEKKK